MSEEGCALFELAGPAFAERMTAVLAPERVILDRALWCDPLRSTAARCTASTPARLELARRENAMLRRGYDALEKAFGGRALVIDSIASVELADAGHRWELEPYHYVPAYNDDAAASLRRLLGLAMTTVVVGGALANKHRNGGSAWVRLSWAEALRDARLRRPVRRADRRRRLRRRRRRPGAVRGRRPTRRRSDAATDAFGFGRRGRARLSRRGRSVLGVERDELLERVGEAALLVNISGHLRWQPAARARCAARAYVDLDPGFTQFWHAAGDARRRLRGPRPALHGRGEHRHAGLPAPDRRACDWRPIRQPVVLERWPVAPSDATLRALHDRRELARRVRAGRAWEGRTLRRSRCTSSAGSLDAAAR